MVKNENSRKKNNGKDKAESESGKKSSISVIYDGKEPEEHIVSGLNDKEFEITQEKTIAENWDVKDWRNLLFFGDNYYSLRYLMKMRESGLLKNADGTTGVKLVYIDPPYATGDVYKASGDVYAFSAKMVGASYLEFLRTRLILLRELLSDNGLIALRIDYHYGHYIKAIMDEVFGIKNFINEIFVNRGRNMAGARGRKFEVDVDSILLYSKSQKYKLNIKEVMMDRPVSEIKWTGFMLAENRNPRERIFLGKVLTPPEGQHWALKQEKVDRILDEYHLRLRCKNKECGTLYYNDDSDSSLFRNMKKKKNRFKFYDITAEKSIHGVRKLDSCIECGRNDFRVDYLGAPVKKLSNIWTDIESYSKKNNYPTENSEMLLERIIRVGSNKDDIVLDCFAGSGTTGMVAEKLERRWIMADFGKLSIETIQKRMITLKKDIGNRKKAALKASPYIIFTIKEV